jgi:hypothetical protein
MQLCRKLRLFGCSSATRSEMRGPPSRCVIKECGLVDHSQDLYHEEIIDYNITLLERWQAVSSTSNRCNLLPAPAPPAPPPLHRILGT